MFHLSFKNQISLQWIESALITICLDDICIPNDYDLTFQHMAHGCDGLNRWYDKAISIIVTTNGKVGYNGEHSPCDALIPAKLMEYNFESYCGFNE